MYDLDPETCRRRAAEYKTAVKAALMERLTPAVAGSVVWAASCYPMVVDWGGLSVQRCGGLERTTPETRRWLFFDESPATEVELGDGLLPSIRRVGAQPGEIFSTEELADIYSAQVGPTELQRSSREAYWTMWRQVLTFGMAHGTMDRLLPMPPQEVRALLMEFMMLGVSAGSLKNVLSAVIHRHRMAGLTPPLVAPGAFKRTMKAVASVTGMPSRLRYPIGTHHLREMLRLCGITGDRGPSLVEHTAMVTSCTGTVCCSRPAELSNMQTCDLKWNHDAAYCADLDRGLAVRIYKRKQDTGRFGLYVRIAPGPMVELLREHIRRLGLRKDQRFTKEAKPGARCPFCDPVFPRLRAGRNTEVLQRADEKPLAQIPRQQISGQVKIESIGVDARRYSGISMRRGGITAAVQARVSEPILYLQSGHGTAMTGRRYVDPVDPRILYETSRAILGEGSGGAWGARP